MKPENGPKFEPHLEREKWEPLELPEEQPEPRRAHYLMSSYNIRESNRARQMCRTLWLIILSLCVIGICLVLLLTLGRH